MRVVVFGAAGSTGRSAVRSLLTDKRVDRVVGVDRRIPAPDPVGVEWREADITTDDLAQAVRGADAVVHLAWALQPAHDQRWLQRRNVDGTRRILEAVIDAGVLALVYVSSVAAYSPEESRRPVDEHYPTDGVPGSVYSAQKSAVERLLDRFEADHPVVRVVRLRPAMVVNPEAARDVHLLVGQRVLAQVLARRGVPIVPDVRGVALQVVHADDLADAVRRAVTGPVAGPFNVAAEAVLTPDGIAEELKGRCPPVPLGLVRWVARTSFALHLQPWESGFLDLALRSPLLDSTRIETELGWKPTRSGQEIVREWIGALVDSGSAGRPQRQVPDVST